MNEEIIYFQLNNWFPVDDYPDAEPFTSWMKDDCHLKFLDKDWVKSNNLCVESNIIDMSISFRITAPKKWVKENCPDLLTKYTDFICTKNKNNIVVDKFGYEFLPYNKENIGVNYLEEKNKKGRRNTLCPKI